MPNLNGSTSLSEQPLSAPYNDAVDTTLLEDLDAVLFDLDGTLHFGDKDELMARLSSISTRLFLGFTESEIHEFGNHSDYRDMRAIMVGEYNRRNPGTQITEDVFQEVNDKVTGSFDDMLSLADYAVEALEAIREDGKATGLVTTRGNQSRVRILARYGIDRMFDVIVGREDCQQRKPHPQPLYVALARLGGIEPARALFIGNSQVDDIGAGNAAEMRTVLVNEDELEPTAPQPTYHWQSLEPLARMYSHTVQLEIS